MESESSKRVIPKFPLRLMPSVRRTAEAFSEKEGVSLNQFINVAVAEKLAHLQHEEWLRNRRPMAPARAAEALELLDKARARPTELGDELPKGYKSIQDRSGRPSVRNKAS